MGDLAYPPFSEGLASKRGSRLSVKDVIRALDSPVDRKDRKDRILEQSKPEGDANQNASPSQCHPRAHLSTGWVIEHGISKDKRDG